MKLHDESPIGDPSVVDIMQLDPIATKEIYKDFIGGKVINKYEMLNNELTLSIKFSELIKHIDTYKKLYALLGFEIIAIGDDAYYIARPDRDSINDIGANLQVILIVLCRGLTTRGISPEILKDPSDGINAQMINDIGSEEEHERILNACNISTPLINAIENLMVDRGLMHKTASGRYILSNASQFIYRLLLEEKR